LLEELAVKLDDVRADLVAALNATPRALTLLSAAKEEVDRLHDEYIGTEHLFITAISDERGDTAQILKKYNVDKERVYRALQEVRGSHRVTDPRAESRYQTLDKYTVDLTALAREGQLEGVRNASPEVRVHVFTDVGHWPYAEPPNMFNALVTDFLG
jgi:ATP-dependent Clp protease ATP-binding subunit ClpA